MTATCPPAPPGAHDRGLELELELDEVRAAATAGLAATPKSLPPWLFYDARGSALFEAITELPEYYLTRAEREIFTAQGPALLDAAGLTTDATVIELGAGSAVKTEVLLAELGRRGGRIRYVPVDVSTSALAQARARLAGSLPGIVVEPWPMATAVALPRLRDLPGPCAVLFIGSSIGNHDEPDAIALLAALRAALAPGAALVLGTDLRKSAAVLVPAYDDRQGVTAAFNRNLLARLNRELGADFELARFRHVALWNEARSRIEMHLESVGAQQVHLGAGSPAIDFADGERIHTESSVKYDRAMVERILGAAGFARTHTFTDTAERFAVHVARAI